MMIIQQCRARETNEHVDSSNDERYKQTKKNAKEKKKYLMFSVYYLISCLTRQVTMNSLSSHGIGHIDFEVNQSPCD